MEVSIASCNIQNVLTIAVCEFVVQGERKSHANLNQACGRKLIDHETACLSMSQN